MVGAEHNEVVSVGRGGVRGPGRSGCVRAEWCWDGTGAVTERCRSGVRAVSERYRSGDGAVSEWC